MMRLPARLTAKLAKVRIAQIFSSARESSLLYCVDPGVILHPGADAPVSREKMRELINNRAPVVDKLPHFFARNRDRKSTRLNSSHVAISYAVFCLKKKIT